MGVDDDDREQSLLTGPRSQYATLQHNKEKGPLLNSANANGVIRDTQFIMVMRHGHREDEADSEWHLKASRPWDPPLSEQGRKEARSAGVDLKKLDVDIVVTSPFLRCLQTSSEIVAELELPQGRWLVDWALSEICDPRLLLEGRAELLSQICKRDIDSWFWDGLSLPEAISKFVEDEVSKSQVKTTPVLWNSKLPGFPENWQVALRRYELAIKNIQKSLEGKNVLIVTHGECLRAGVNLYYPKYIVYSVKHTGFIRAERRKDSSGKWGDWQLTTEPGETGVHWYH